MAITTKVLGKTKKGDTVTLYTMENKNGLKATVTNLGAIWLELWAPDKNGTFSDVVLGYDTPESIFQNSGEMGAIVGRNANRIKNAAFTLDGKTYQLAKNNGENNLHSGPDKLSKRMFQANYGRLEDADFVTFSLYSPEGDQGYPGTLSIEVTYTFTDENAFLIEYKLTAGDKDTIANFTCHPYFNLGGHKSGSTLSQEIWIDANEICEIDAGCAATGRLLQVENTPFDFRSPKALGRDIAAENVQLRNGNGYDHNFCLNHPVGRMTLSATAYDRESGRFMEVYTGRPGLQLYSGNGLDPEIEAKDGAHYHPHDGYAFETQLYPNAINVPEWEQPIIAAGSTQYSLTSYKFSVK